MRIAVLVVGLIAAIVSGVGGFVAQTGANEDKASFAASRKLGLAMNEEVVSERLWRGHVVTILYFIGAGLGAFASFLAFSRRRFAAAALFIVVGVGPAVFFPLLIVFTGLLAVAGLLALFIGPGPRPEAIS